MKLGFELFTNEERSRKSELISVIVCYYTIFEWSTHKIAKSLNLHQNWVIRNLKKQGIAMRPNRGKATSQGGEKCGTYILNSLEVE